MMERRTLIAMVIAMGLLGLNIWVQERFFPSEPAPAPATAPEVTAKAADPAPRPPVSPPRAPAAPVAPMPSGPRPPQRLVPVEARHYRAVISSEGGKLQELTLKYRGDKPLVVLGELGPAGLLVADSGRQPESVAMAVSKRALDLRSGRRETLELSGEAGGLRVLEALEFPDEGYAFVMRLRIENPGSGPRAIVVEVPWVTRASWGTSEQKFQGQHPTEIVWESGGHIRRIETLTEVGQHAVDGRWIGLGSVWYLAALKPETPGFSLIADGDRGAPEGTGAGGDTGGWARIAARAAPTIPAGGIWEGRLVIYAGPKEYDRLRDLGLESTINFGGFPIPRAWGGLPMEWLGVPILLLMNWVYHYVGNYGVAIILLTVISKVLFFPLTVKSMRSMKAMQALQPRINALRTKYQKDPQRLQRETMALYKEFKVNPLGGCLPMVAQIPIFYALYLALSVSVELQNAPFICVGRAFGADLWICDLAAQDPTYALPLLMGVTMFVQQKLQPMVGDPRQAKMMLMMPVVFTFMFLSLPAGLVLYWTVSNVLQIAQQKLMDRGARTSATREAKDVSRA